MSLAKVINFLSYWMGWLKDGVMNCMPQSTCMCVSGASR